MKRSRKRPLEKPSNELEPESPLCLLLLKKWSLGSLSAVEVQEIAHASRLTGCHSADVTALAQLGASGEQPDNAHGNAHRDLVRKFFKNLTMPEPFILHTKVWRKNAGGERVKQEAEIPLFLQKPLDPNTGRSCFGGNTWN